MSGRYVHVIWCDDIRQEVGNKPSFMGVYTGGILLPGLPTVLPKLSVYVWVNTPIDQPFKKLIIRVVRDDGFPLLEMQPETPEDDLVAPARPDSTRRVAMAGFTLGGVEVPVGCKYFGVVVETESETLEGPRLRIDVNQQLFAHTMGYPVTQSGDDLKADPVD